jgi:hypothetical protein
VLSGCFDQPPEQGDRDLVLGIEQLEPHGLTLPADFAAYEKLSRERWIDCGFSIFVRRARFGVFE